MLVLVGDALLNLGKFSLHPSIGFISMGVQLGQSLEAFFGAVVVDEPTGRLNCVSCCILKYLRENNSISYLGEKNNQQTQNYGREDLKTQRQLPLRAVGWSKSNICAV